MPSKHGPAMLGGGGAQPAHTTLVYATASGTSLSRFGIPTANLRLRTTSVVLTKSWGGYAHITIHVLQNQKQRNQSICFAGEAQSLVAASDSALTTNLSGGGGGMRG